MANRNVFGDLQSFLSGGNLGTAQDYLTSAPTAVAGIQLPDLMALIPRLQMQVMQGLLTPAQAAAAMQQIQGSMTPAQYEVVTAVVQGRMDPATAEAALQQDSAMQGVQTDAESIAGIRSGLSQLSNIAQNKGLTEADRAQFNTIMNQANANAAQQRAAQLQQLQMQGNAGTGAELAARLAGGQQTANSNAAAGAQLATAAQARALQAIQAGISGNQALNTTLFDQNASKAKAQDVVNQFNTAAKNAVNQANAGYQQQANQANFQTANTLEAQNAAAANAAKQQNAQNVQQANNINFTNANTVAGQNAARQQETNLTNANLNQQANTANFNMANTIAANNTGIANENLKMPGAAAQQQYKNSLDKATAVGNLQNAAGANLVKLGTTEAANTAAGINSLLANVSGNWVKDATGAIGKFVNGLFQPATNASDIAAGNAASVAAGGTAGTNIADSSYGGGGDYSGYTTGSDQNTGATEESSWVDQAGSWLSDLFSDERLKTDKKPLTDAEVDKMMASLTGYKYRYKGPKTNPMQQGVMAQDMEKGMGSVINTPAGKMVQKPEALSKALAVIANQHERIKRLEGKS